MHNNPVLLRLRPNHVSSHSAVVQDVECLLCSLPGGFQRPAANRNPMQVRLRLHARCMPLLQMLDLAAKSDMLADSCQLMGIPATSLIHCR